MAEVIKKVVTVETTERTPDPKPVPPAFSYKTVSSFTGKIQFRVNGPEVVNTPFGETYRGEVKHVKSDKYANGLVENGDHAHVPADTPVGIPDEFKPKKKADQGGVIGTLKAGAAAVKAAVTGSESASTASTATGSGSTEQPK